MYFSDQCQVQSSNVVLMLLKSVSSSKFNVQCNTVRYTIHFSGQCQVQGSNVILLRYTLYLLGQGQVQS